MQPQDKLKTRKKNAILPHLPTSAIPNCRNLQNLWLLGSFLFYIYSYYVGMMVLRKSSISCMHVVSSSHQIHNFHVRWASAELLLLICEYYKSFKQCRSEDLQIRIVPSLEEDITFSHMHTLLSTLNINTTFLLHQNSHNSFKNNAHLPFKTSTITQI